MQRVQPHRSVIDTLRKYQSLRLMFRVFRECRVGLHVARNRLAAIATGNFHSTSDIEYMQSVPQFSMALSDFANIDGLSRALTEAGIHQDHGAHAVYLRPQRRLRHVLGDVVDKFPPDAGFKILRVFEPPDRASYIWNADVRPVTRLMMGPVVNQALAANALHCLGLGPPCYGVVHLKAGVTDLTAFVTRHIEGDTPSLDEAQTFVAEIHSAVREGVIEIVPKSGITDADFLLPGCNGNLLRERATGKLQYVDFQRFVSRPKRLLDKIARESAETLHFGGTSTLFRRGKRYLYQSIPGLGGSGKRDTLYRWRRFQSVLDAHHISYKGRVVLDVCCNSGMMLSQALRAGAEWGLGWDLPHVVTCSEKVMTAVGASRATLIPANLAPNYDLTDSIPDWLRPRLSDSVVLYLAAIQHVGVIRDLARVPWRALIWEGHQGESDADTDSYLNEMRSVWNCRVAHRDTLSDGDCGRRAFALLVRE